MLKVTWEWIGIYEPALDVANTVAISRGVEHDLLSLAGEYRRWAEAAAASPQIPASSRSALLRGQPHVLTLRSSIRAVIAAAADGTSLPSRAVAELNRLSRAAPEWPEVDGDGVMRTRSRGSRLEQLLAVYARSAMRVVTHPSGVRRCPAPSCGMFYRPSRRAQHWCSTQCGTRARVARHSRSIRVAAKRS